LHRNKRLNRKVFLRGQAAARTAQLLTSHAFSGFASFNQLVKR
jgi:hypothetical protein